MDRKQLIDYNVRYIMHIKHCTVYNVNLTIPSIQCIKGVKANFSILNRSGHLTVPLPSLGQTKSCNLPHTPILISRD